MEGQGPGIRGLAQSAKGDGWHNLELHLNMIPFCGTWQPPPCSQSKVLALHLPPRKKTLGDWEGRPHTEGQYEHQERGRGMCSSCVPKYQLHLVTLL